MLRTFEATRLGGVELRRLQYMLSIAFWNWCGIRWKLRRRAKARAGFCSFRSVKGESNRAVGSAEFLAKQPSRSSYQSCCKQWKAAKTGVADVPTRCRFQSWQKTFKARLTACSLPLLTPLAHSSHWRQYPLSSSSNATNVDSIFSLYTGHDVSEVRVGCKINRFLSAKGERITSVSFISRFCLAFFITCRGARTNSVTVCSLKIIRECMRKSKGF